jgi:hypothetical protein
MKSVDSKRDVVLLRAARNAPICESGPYRRTAPAQDAHAVISWSVRSEPEAAAKSE